jgi:ketosteroid isomerase-like protein
MTLTFHLSFTLKTGEAMEIDCRHTAIWVNRRGKWLIVHEHISAPLNGQIRRVPENSI